MARRKNTKKKKVVDILVLHRFFIFLYIICFLSLHSLLDTEDTWVGGYCCVLQSRKLPCSFFKSNLPSTPFQFNMDSFTVYHLFLLSLHSLQDSKGTWDTRMLPCSSVSSPHVHLSRVTSPSPPSPFPHSSIICLCIHVKRMLHRQSSVLCPTQLVCIFLYSSPCIHYDEGCLLVYVHCFGWYS